MTTYYVSTTGSNSGTGTSTSPWRSINFAMQSNLKPGDDVVVRPGTYNESISIDRDGSSAGYITLRSEVPGEALIRPPAGAWNAISVNANYVAIDGFDIKGGGGDGIEGNSVHHVKILNNKVHDAGESGIQFNGSEFMTIEGNETYANASSGWFSGISIYQARNITGDTATDGFRTIVRNNVSHDNVTKSGQHTDGNGIIIDDFQSTQTSGHPNYTFPTLVENNLVYENGGKGIQVTWSDHVTVRNNTAYHNNQDPLNTGTWRGELSNSQSSNNTWVNNIAVADPKLNSNNTAIDNTSYGGYTNKGTVWHNNITYNGTSGQASVKTDGGNAMPTTADGNKLGVDPKFVQAGTDFHLQATSPAVDAGTNDFGLGAKDLDGQTRANGTVDIGADELSGTSAPSPSANDAPHSIVLQGTTVSETAAAGTVIGQISATDPDGDRIVFNVSGDARFAVNSSNQLVVASGANLAVTSDQRVSLTLTANDGHGGTASAGIAVTIQDAATTGQTLEGDAGNNKIYGGNGSDRLFGYAGWDTLSAGAGNDMLQGGTGKDALTGGEGADTFVFLSRGEAGRGSVRDVITDFSHDQGDVIDLHVIDADSGKAGDQAFTFVAATAFSGHAGELRYSNGLLSADLDGDKRADLQIEIANSAHLGATDFML
ncbi:choice-of-anchor Q domain-containing protein [Rubellimicrobium arenae]|uniref:choice-of-anchor Q domain-containing protein n=1 Tax=Rubellimicrobium arenae TaxID=2817372 RepID=UPI001B310F79|nr:choice-of-anchor Q domain-containing protein [Rubellimicrobium arenae]